MFESLASCFAFRCSASLNMTRTECGRSPVLMRYWKVNQFSRSIVLIGMMGVGKSSVGRCLQHRTGLALHDTDVIVAVNFEMSIPEIFSKFGEQRFREAET